MNNMMDGNHWFGGMGWGMWIIPLVGLLIIVFLIRGNRKK